MTSCQSIYDNANPHEPHYVQESVEEISDEFDYEDYLVLQEIDEENYMR